jgi:hypothetical protein
MDHDRIVEQLLDRCKCFIEPILQVETVICLIDGRLIFFEGVPRWLPHRAPGGFHSVPAGVNRGALTRSQGSARLTPRCKAAMLGNGARR